VGDQKYWLGFSLVPEIGVKRITLLLNAFGSLANAWVANSVQLEQAGLDQTPIANLLRLRKQLDLNAEMAKVERNSAWLLTLNDERYPTLLAKQPDAPPVLYIKGTLIAQDDKALSMVGTRKATTYGRDAAYHLAKNLVKHGVTVISGLAHGIDSAAHRGALEGGGRTIAVMGCGIDKIYPNDNTKLAHQIIEQGALISEFPIGMPPESRNFPRRNRIISGLSLGVLVVEAPEKSGAMITASVAAEQGREVFAVPGNIFSPASTGTNRLIQDGAKLVTNVNDILTELNITQNAIETRIVAEKIAPSTDLEENILEHLGLDPIHVDELVRLSGLPVATISSTLTILELKGLARSVGHMQYCLVPDL